MRRLAAGLLVAVMGIGLGACEDGLADGGLLGERRPSLAPVEGSSQIKLVDIAPRPVVPGGASGVSLPAVDERRARQFGTGTARWLDQHLSQLQNGEPLGKLRGSRLVPATPAATPHPALAAATSALASPQQPVGSAAYDIRVAARGRPAWAQVRVTVTDADGATHRADFVFEPSGKGPRPVAFGPVRGRGG